ncbi:acyl-coenzyme A synthetase ACSM3, mitochondrial-like isoform X2 [Physella acuta]|nr:acyl-coenzyme A synthetase ACSM3, mitochondrial-like isoform X2 [Physella acuta]XP_059167994.1 acyl-coenzyme A synthetase ACSM3, mitochondrial-like isoform X2 [Physella acuta]XP_059167995.1 acyl-coenzyme A synthetase ACSM3, mitochondrial-like isoform X2 [Physella acuta]
MQNTGVLQIIKRASQKVNKLQKLNHIAISRNINGYHYQSTRSLHIPLNGYSFTDYNLEKKSFSLQVPNNFNFVKHFIDEWARAERLGLRNTSNPALWWVNANSKKEIKFSFQQLSEHSQRIANALTMGCGLKRQDRVIIILPKVPEWWLIFLACIRADLTVCPGTMMLKTYDVKHRLELSKASCIITSPELVSCVDQASQECEHLKTKIVVGDKEETRPGWLNFDALVEKAGNQFQCVNTKASDPMMIFFTSGTTGAPKMAEHTHSSYGLGHITSARYFLMVNSESVMWNLSDTGWAKSAWSSFFSPWIMGACVFVYSAERFDPTETLQVLSRYPVTHFCSSPTGLRMILAQNLRNTKFLALRRCLGAGEPVNPEIMEHWRRETGLTIYEGYGQTETTLVCSSYNCIRYKPGSMGKSSPELDVRIVDDDGRVVDPGVEGNIALRTKPYRPIGLFKQYVNDPVRTAAAFRGDFYITGDRGYMDEEDYVYFVGRADDVINSAGYRIGPFEVESVLLEHPAVLESAVVSSPDELRGEVVKAFVTLAPEYKSRDPDELVLELQNHVKKSTAPYKYPRKIEFIDELPKTVSGKIRRVELRNKEWQSALNPPPSLST